MMVNSLSRWMVGVAGMLMISGCAGQRTAQTINRLQASVDLLDQRVTQLERTNLSPSAPSASASPSDAVTIEPVVVSSARAAQPAKAHAKTWSSVKPTTKEIQQALKNAGFYQGTLDGRMGPMTREAVRQFQNVNGLKVDGVVGKQTWEKLSTYHDLAANGEGGEASAAESLK